MTLKKKKRKPGDVRHRGRKRLRKQIGGCGDIS